MSRRGLLAGVIATVAAIAAMAPSALAADIPHYTNDRQDVPAEYRTFVLDTTDTPFSKVAFDEGEWTHTTADDNNAWWPTVKDAGLSIPDVGEWTDEAGSRHAIDMRLELDQ